MSRPIVSLIGKKFGRLTVICIADRGKYIKTKWKCRCDCGNYVSILVTSLNSGNTKSCGCLHKDITRNLFTKHGHNKPKQRSLTYTTWDKMLQRCNNSNNNRYNHYGGRGIKICDRWQGKDGFVNFLADMGERLDKKYSIDRIDNNGDYCKENCRWITMKEQNRNCSRNIILDFHGETKCLEDFARQYSIHPEVLRYRICKAKWPIEKALGIKI